MDTQLKSMIKKHLAWAMEANHANNELEQEHGKDEVWKHGQPIICEGKPGTSKMTVVLDVAKAAAAKSASVFLTVITDHSLPH